VPGDRIALERRGEEIYDPVSSRFADAPVTRGRLRGNEWGMADPDGL